MSEASESLILGSGQQLALLDIDGAGLPAAAYELSEQQGRFTGERIFSTNPKLYHAIAALLGRSVPYREISEICSVSVNVVCAVSQREGIPIETIRERVGRMGLDVAALTIEAIRDLLADPDARAKLGMRDLAIAHGIAVQNAQLLLGGVTARIENAGPIAKPGHATYLDYIKNVTATGLAGEKAPQKEPGAIEVQASAVEAKPVEPTPEPGT